MKTAARSRPQESDEAYLRVVQRIAAEAISQTLARVRGYLGRGRLLAGLPVQSLRAQWIEAHLAVRVLRAAHREQELRDLETEFDLRGLAPPYPLVAADAARFRERFETEWRKRKPDPVVLERTEQELDELCDRLIAEDREAMPA
jgi:hypothetical protein